MTEALPSKNDGKFWTTPHSEIMLMLFWGLIAAFLVVIVVVVPVLLRQPLVVNVIIGGGTSLIIPIFLGRRITSRWTSEAHQVAEDHPFLFLKKIHDIRRAGNYVEIAAIIAAIIIVSGRNQLSGFFAANPLVLALFEFWPIELVFVQSQLSFWRPAPLDGVKASLSSDSDEEKIPGLTWIDESITYFNRLSGKKLGVSISADLSLDILLFAASNRSLRMSLLLSNFDPDEPNYMGFITDVSNIAQKPVSQVLERAGLIATIKKNQVTILNVSAIIVTTLIALSPYIVQYFVDPLISEWSQLLR